MKVRQGHRKLHYSIRPIAIDVTRSCLCLYVGYTNVLCKTAELTEVSFGELTQVHQGPLGVSAAVYAAK